jgi:hypothetical protein
MSVEIKRIRKELMSVAQERERSAAEAEKDREEFEKYRKRALKRKRNIRHETDSIRLSIDALKQNKDSLNAVLAAEKSRKRQYELLQDNLRRTVIQSCELILQQSQNAPPTGASKNASSLNLLLNELQAKTIDNVEALSRLFQIIRDMVGLTSSIQIVQGTSPIPEIRGTVYRLRIGTVFEAVVNEKGTQAAVWTGYDTTGTTQWEKVTDVVIASNILAAVNVREGKKLPSLIELPFDHVAVSEGESDDNE